MGGIPAMIWQPEMDGFLCFTPDPWGNIGEFLQGIKGIGAHSLDLWKGTLIFQFPVPYIFTSKRDAGKPISQVITVDPWFQIYRNWKMRGYCFHHPKKKGHQQNCHIYIPNICFRNCLQVPIPEGEIRFWPPGIRPNCVQNASAKPCCVPIFGCASFSHLVFFGCVESYSGWKGAIWSWRGSFINTSTKRGKRR